MTANSSTPFGFYDIDRKYIEFLKKADEHVPDCDYEDRGRSRKFYCGPVTNQYGIDYFVPVSSKTDKNMYIVGSAKNGVREYHGIILKDASGQETGSLNFKNMIPCVDPQFLTPHKPTGHAVSEYNFCKKYEKAIKTTAESTFKNIESREYPELTKSSVNASKVESAGWEYLDMIEAKKECDKMATRFQEIDDLASNIQTTKYDNEKSR